MRNDSLARRCIGSLRCRPYLPARDRRNGIGGKTWRLAVVGWSRSSKKSGSHNCEVVWLTGGVGGRRCRWSLSLSVVVLRLCGCS